MHRYHHNPVRWTLFLLISFTLPVAGCSCLGHPDITRTENVGPKEERQVRCECGVDFKPAAALLGFYDQTFTVDTCLPSDLNEATASPEELAVLELMTDEEYADTVKEFCLERVTPMIEAVAATAAPLVCDYSSYVTISCHLTPIGTSDRGTTVNPMCDDPCGAIACNSHNCNPNELIDEENQITPEYCRCTQASDCDGELSESICTTPNWMVHSPTIASGLMAYMLSAPNKAVLNEGSSADITVSVDAGFPCGNLSDSATTNVYGSATLFGPPCPEGECAMPMEFVFAIDDFTLEHTCALIFSQTNTVTNAVVTGGTEGRLITVRADGTAIIPTGTLRITGSFIRNGDERYIIDAYNEQPIEMVVNFSTREFRLEGDINFADGVARPNVVGTIAHLPPRANAGSDIEVECDQEGGSTVTLDGSASMDLDDDIRVYNWWQEEMLVPENFLGQAKTLPVTAPLGETTYYLSVTDQSFLSATDSVHVRVVDTTPPEVDLVLSPSVLWPPTHSMVEVTAQIVASDVCDTDLQVELVAITSNDTGEMGSGPKGDDIVDAEFGTDDRTFQLRASRSGTGEGRTYTITYVVRDGSGNETLVSGDVFVPHSRRR